MARLPAPLKTLGTSGQAWKNRRRIIHITLIWCAVMVTYLAIWGRLHTVTETTILGLLALAGSTIGSYVFGAVWDDSNIRNTGVAEQAVDQGIPPVTNQNVNVGGPTVTTTADPKPPPGFAE
jgi:hypothetical protein